METRDRFVERTGEQVIFTNEYFIRLVRWVPGVVVLGISY